jgi:hypothetical protein
MHLTYDNDRGWNLQHHWGQRSSRLWSWYPPWPQLPLWSSWLCFLSYTITIPLGILRWQVLSEGLSPVLSLLDPLFSCLASTLISNTTCRPLHSLAIGFPAPCLHTCLSFWLHKDHIWGRYFTKICLPHTSQPAPEGQDGLLLCPPVHRTRTGMAQVYKKWFKILLNFKKLNKYRVTV